MSNQNENDKRRRDIALDIYNSFKGKKRTFIKNPNVNQNGNNETKKINGEPLSVGELLNELVVDRDWKEGLAEGEIFVKWREIVGDEIAERSEPIEIKDKKLFIKCVSTAWATQLNLVKRELLESIKKIAPGIDSLEILGPNAPSWRRGLRTIQGSRGPRDTYG